MQGIEPPPQAEITITDSAKEFFEKFANMNGQSLLLDKDKEFVYLNIKVMAGGCSGRVISLDLESSSCEWNPLTDHLLMSNNITILISSKSYDLVKGLVIDYNNDLMASGISFNFPNADHVCGCGKSWN